jgi:hypothetical protein
MLTSVLATKHESTFDHVCHHQDALGIVQHFFGDAFVGGRHNGVNHIDRRLQPRHRILRAEPASAYVPNIPMMLINNSDIVFFMKVFL